MTYEKKGAFDWYLGCWRKFGVFSGRAGVDEFWGFFKANVVVGILLSVLEKFVGLSFLSTLYGLAIFLPTVSLGVRRFHDRGKRGLIYWCYTLPVYAGVLAVGICAALFRHHQDVMAACCWIVAVLILFGLFLFVNLVSMGDAGTNRYGKDPEPWNAVDRRTEKRGLKAQFAECLAGYRKYAVFSGRASRNEFWGFFGLNIVGLCIIWFGSLYLIAPHMEYFPLGMVLKSYLAITFLPMVSAGVRRFHDCGRSLKDYLCYAIPLWGSLAVLMFPSFFSQAIVFASVGLLLVMSVLLAIALASGKGRGRGNKYGRSLLTVLMVLACGWGLFAADASGRKGDVQAQWTDYWLRHGRNPDCARVKKLLEDGADVNTQMQFGTALEQLSGQKGEKGLENRLAVMKILLEKGADPNAEPKYDMSVLANVVRWMPGSERMELVRMLLEKGADPNRPGRMGRIPLEELFQFGIDDEGAELAGLLVARGAEVEGKTLLGGMRRWKLTKGKFDLVKTLVEKGAIIDDLAIGAAWPDVEIRRYLLKKANVDESEFEVMDRAGGFSVHRRRSSGRHPHAEELDAWRTHEDEHFARMESHMREHEARMREMMDRRRRMEEERRRHEEELDLERQRRHEERMAEISRRDAELRKFRASVNLHMDESVRQCHETRAPSQRGRGPWLVVWIFLAFCTLCAVPIVMDIPVWKARNGHDVSDIEHIKDLMKSGDIKGAADSLKKFLVAEPDNAEAKMLYGTCCHLLGDDKTFCSIHDGLASKMEKEKDAMLLSHWQKYHRLYEYLTVAALVIGAAAGCAYYFCKEVRTQLESACLGLYAGPGYYTTNTATRVQRDADNHVRLWKAKYGATEKFVDHGDRR